MKQFIRHFWGTIVRPQVTFEALAVQRTVRWAVVASCLPVLQVWGNVALHAVFGLDWLGTKPLLANPTFVGGYGHWRVNLADWVLVFVTLMPLLALLSLILNAGVAHLMSKLWGGQGTFEQMINTLAFASAVPSIMIGGVSEWIFSVPMDLITGHPYWWAAAMQGEFGPVVGAVWNFYVLGVYIGLQWVWIIVLGSIAIRRIQRIPAWASVVTMLVAFAVSMFVWSVFVR
ncbi:MAG: YIP1 family protein [Chloroflexota bacterium]